MFLTENNLLERFRENLQEAYQVDIAVPWVSLGKALDILISFNNLKIRAAVGISGNATHPDALKQLNESGELRIAEGTPLTHCKLYIFYKNDSTIFWVTSANLTRSGFELNRELCYEYSGDEKPLVWFEEYWNTLPESNKEAFDAYCNNWVPGVRTRKDSNVKKYSKSDSLNFNRKAPYSWLDFMSALEAADDFWESDDGIGVSVFGDDKSWLNTIRLGKAVICRDSWDELSVQDYQVITGVENQGQPCGFGSLGSLTGAGHVKNVFRCTSTENVAIRSQIREAIEPCLKASFDQFPETAGNFIETVSGLPRFSGATASRLLALGRPDLAVSVNKASRPRLAEFSGLAFSTLVSGSPKNQGKTYKRLLEFLQSLEWYTSPRQTSRFEQTIAENRAALLDAIVYNPGSK